MKFLKNAENESKMKISRAKPEFSGDKRVFYRLDYLKNMWYNIITKGNRDAKKNRRRVHIMKKYEARLSVSQWSNSGWIFEHDVVEVWNVEESKVDEWIEDIKTNNEDLFQYVTDAFREWDNLPDYDEIDNEWSVTLVKIEDGGSEKILALTSVWESELAKEWFNN